MADPSVGIDLGTTHSVAAVFRGDAPEILYNARGTCLVPSVVALDDGGRLLVGEAAAERQRSGSAHAVSRFKSAMGTDATFPLGDRSLSATALSALVLREMREMAAAALGAPVDRAVVSVPAWFREPQRAATVEAAHLAGLEVTRLINEPTAAALSYGLRAGPDPIVVAVLDLGGGTFDVSLIEFFDGIADVRASVGDVNLGGEDATDALVAWATERMGAVPIGPRAAHLRTSAEATKRRLSVEPRATLRVEGHALEITRSELEALLGPLASRMRGCLGELRGQEGFRPPDVVLLVGGAARMPWVARAAHDALDVAPDPFRDGDTAVALGAAIQAGLVDDHSALREILVSDVLTHSLGVATNRRVGDTWLPDRFDPILSRGTTLPTSRTSIYSTLRHDQTTVVFRIYEGEHRQADHNHLLGELRIDDLPEHEDRDARWGIEVRFSHDVSGLLEIEARRIGSTPWRTLVLHRGGLVPDDQDERRRLEDLVPLKTHPRDLLPNRWMLERGNRVLTLTSGGLRRRIDAAMDRFEAALATHDRSEAEAARLVLQDHVQRAIDDLGLEIEPWN